MAAADEGEWEDFEEEYIVLAEMEGLDAALMQQDLSYSLVVCTVIHHCLLYVTSCLFFVCVLSGN